MRDEVAAAMLLETPGINVNKVCGNDMETALHVAVDERFGRRTIWKEIAQFICVG